ncbi:MAG: hypothetical protein ACOWYE_11565 [Desulfatiglandales bacterium]
MYAFDDTQVVIPLAVNERTRTAFKHLLTSRHNISAIGALKASL